MNKKRQTILKSRRQVLSVEWRHCAWQPGITRLPRFNSGRGSLSTGNLQPSTPNPFRRGSLIFAKSMKKNSRRSRAFTLIELLVVIAIIVILVAMLLPVLVMAKDHANVAVAQLQVSELVTAIQKYDSDYGRFPVSQAAQAAANPDFTYGGTFQSGSGQVSIGTPISGNVVSNDEVMAILMNFTNYPGGGATVNTNYQKNPQKTVYLQPHMSGWNPSQGTTPKPGVGTDLVYRDPWGNPYIITMDLNYDEMCEDALYQKALVSKDTVSQTGINGLIQAAGDAVNAPNNWAYRGKVMVWSAGPDGAVNQGVSAKTGENIDNVLSWKP